MNKKIVCLTYQSFPSKKANSIATIATLKSFKKLGFDVELIFPNRRKDSSSDLSKLRSFYEFNEDIKIKMLSHNLPFDKFTKFKLLLFNISHFIWSIKAVFKIGNNKNDFYYTRSDWILLFLALRGRKVVFECHNYSRIRRLILNFVKNKNHVLVVFINDLLVNYFSYSEPNFIVLNSAFDEDEFVNKSIKKINKKVIFIGHLLRFEKGRNVEFLINAFKDIRLQEFELVIAGGPKNYAKKLSEQVTAKNIQIAGWLKRKEVVNLILESEVGILINSEDTIHSKVFTSPIKYFEYLRGGLKVLAVDFTSHTNLPYSEDITFFSNNNTEDFINKLLNLYPISNTQKDVASFSYIERTKNIIARLEGLEPPTL